MRLTRAITSRISRGLPGHLRWKSPTSTPPRVHGTSGHHAGAPPSAAGATTHRSLMPASITKKNSQQNAPATAPSRTSASTYSAVTAAFLSVMAIPLIKLAHPVRHASRGVGERNGSWG